MLRTKPDQNEQKKLCYDAYLGQTERLKAAINDNLDLNFTNYISLPFWNFKERANNYYLGQISPLGYAILGGKVDTVQLLIENENINLFLRMGRAKDYNAFTFAARLAGKNPKRRGYQRINSILKKKLENYPQYEKLVVGNVKKIMEGAAEGAGIGAFTGVAIGVVIGGALGTLILPGLGTTIGAALGTGVFGITGTALGGHINGSIIYNTEKVRVEHANQISEIKQNVIAELDKDDQKTKEVLDEAEKNLKAQVEELELKVINIDETIRNAVARYKVMLTEKEELMEELKDKNAAVIVEKNAEIQKQAEAIELHRNQSRALASRLKRKIEELAETKNELAETKNELAETKSELAKKEVKFVETKNELPEVPASIKQAESSSASLLPIQGHFAKKNKPATDNKAQSMPTQKANLK